MTYAHRAWSAVKRPQYASNKVVCTKYCLRLKAKLLLAVLGGNTEEQPVVIEMRKMQ